MNPNLVKLFQIAQKPERRIVGLMSGTSMDGLDIAVCRFSGSGSQTHVKLEHFDTVIFSEDIKDEIRKVFAKKEIDFQLLCLLNAWIGKLHGKMILDSLKNSVSLPTT